MQTIGGLAPLWPIPPATRMDLTPQLLSSLLGYASIACWVIAQAPQIVENYFQQSCDGLALPFLLNWLCGDITNVIGCMLTDQKEFQTLLATYFCLVDLLLTGQYAYYTRLRARKRHALHHTEGGAEIEYETVPGLATGNGSGFIGTASTSHPTSPVISGTGLGDSERSPLLRATIPSIHSAALDVARAAERIERRRSQSARRKQDRYADTRSTSDHHQHPQVYIPPHPQHHEQQPSVPSSLWTATASTKSSGYLSAPDRESRRGRARGRESSSSAAAAVVGALDVDPEAGVLASTLSATGYDAHGRSISTSPRAKFKRTLPGTSSSPSSKLKRTTSTTGDKRQRAAGVVFMSVFLLAGIGRTGWKMSESASPARDQTGDKGIVIVPRRVEGMWESTTDNAFHIFPTIPDQQQHHDRPSEIVHFVSRSDHTAIPSGDAGAWIFNEAGRKGDPSSNNGHYQRVIGRASAWICTTLYLTSRLPQIWKNVRIDSPPGRENDNYTRKSVEGLSILLFVFAFMGNATYVGSIMLNPGAGDGEDHGGSEEERAYYLLEALPYRPPLAALGSEHPVSRTESENRSFTSLGPVDEESQLLLKDDFAGSASYNDAAGYDNGLSYADDSRTPTQGSNTKVFPDAQKVLVEESQGEVKASSVVH
ncbi:hypothetical protein QFC19_001617 [Naganishia cerealis]|uniref:Uncharacterized protein n=1 Tax=Naganishia cerealis TaxID=610337 RepID=A0ACC2WHD6_9TREE|nr:hypothetical protein QFC19_001617 [Naganishia cerealis]